MTSAFSWQNSISLCHSTFQGQICLLLQVFLDFLLLHSSPLWWKGHLLAVLVLEGLVSLHRIIQLQLLQHYWLRHRLGLLWYWMVCFGNEQRSSCPFWNCTQVMYFRLFCWLWELLHFFYGILAHSSRYNGLYFCFITYLLYKFFCIPLSKIKMYMYGYENWTIRLSAEELMLLNCVVG